MKITVTDQTGGRMPLCVRHAPTYVQVLEHPWVARDGFATGAAAASGKRLSIDTERMPAPHPVPTATPHEALMSQLLEGLEVQQEKKAA